MTTLFVKALAADPSLALAVAARLDRGNLTAALDLLELEALQEKHAAGDVLGALTTPVATSGGRPVN